LESNQQESKGNWRWTTADPDIDLDEIIYIQIERKSWKGNAELWINATNNSEGYKLKVTSIQKVREKVMPPLPYPVEEFRYYSKLAENKL
jgi:hypothetical protein